MEVRAICLLAHGIAQKDLDAVPLISLSFGTKNKHIDFIVELHFVFRIFFFKNYRHN